LNDSVTVASKKSISLPVGRAQVPGATFNGTGFANPNDEFLDVESTRRLPHLLTTAVTPTDPEDPHFAALFRESLHNEWFFDATQELPISKKRCVLQERRITVPYPHMQVSYQNIMEDLRA